MKKTFARAAFAAALLCTSAGAALVAVPHAAYAADEPKVSRDVGKALQAAVEAAQKKDFPTALANIKTAQAVSDKTPFDDFKINEILAYIAINQQDYATADTAYEAMADSPAMPEDSAKQTLHNALLLASQEKHWPKVVTYGARLDTLKAMDEKTYVVLAQAYYMTNDMANAQTAAQKSIDLAKAAGHVPEQAALQIVMSADAKANNQAAALQTLEQLAVYYNAPDDWGKLIDVGLSTPHIQELDALYFYRLRFLANANVTGEDYSIAAGIALHLGYPAEAKSDLEKGVSAGALSDRGKTAAQMAKASSDTRMDEHSLSAFAAAAQRAKSGEQAVKLAEDYWGYGRYADAAAAAQEGIAKGYSKDPTEGQFILGAALIAQGKYADGRAALAKVDGSAARAKAAHLWDLYAQSKMQQTAAAAPAKAQ
ncbi:MAG: hypothetical protein KGR48_07870 [Alphaproteobacteria bacterium]|nr:hypothetical protein [Alphaproteobacteria bacterium]MBU6471446.1 hypothetical protein [Alphaproteobacteria bacterium]MDE2011885.1 hypothetical protein [Alphaproteobacteria bacterium]MDE2073685.1 hypothetical protein [Alphaproteobacteria bacterium]MDE2351814.1 hypothetical protein [Alphaproteobacteria bacterium]